MKLEWSRRARGDLEEIGSTIAADDPHAARAWIERIRARAREAAAVPGIGRRVPEYARADVREVLLRSYRIIYLELRTRIVVLTVAEGHRLLPPFDEVV